MKDRILVVEDSRTQAEALRSLLTDEQYEVEVAESAEKAIEIVQNTSFDLILTDVMMHGLTGFDLCRRLKDDPKTRSIPVVVLTSLKDPMDIIGGLESGADNYITKPYDPEHLLRRVRYVLDNRKLRTESKASLGVSVRFIGREFSITSEREQILDLFIATVEEVVRTNEALSSRERELAEANSKLEALAKRKAREALVSHQRLNAMIDASPVPIILLDRDGRVQLWSRAAARTFEVSAEEVLNHPPRFLGPELQDEFSQICSRMLKGDGIVEGVELESSRSDGSPLHLAVYGSCVRDEDGEILGAMVAAADMTERKNAERAQQASEAADRANRAKSEFLSRMSHELRTPLNAILGFAQLLEFEVDGPDNEESVEQILFAGRHLLQLVDEVLDLTRIESGRTLLELEPVAVEEVVEESIQLVAPISAQHGVSIDSTSAEGGEAFVLADEQRLKQVLLNVLSNAIKYNRRGGKVTVGCRPSDSGGMVISVQDTGCGIPADRMSRLFTPFDRLGAEQTETEGTGLGLVLSKNLIEEMGGRFELQSREGIGTCVEVHLPLAEATIAEKSVRPVAPVPELKGGEPAGTVLLVEDNLANVRLFERLFRDRTKVRILTAMQGSMGLTLAREHRPDVILLDLNLPDQSGTDVLAALKKDSRLESVPVIIISGDAMPTQVDRLLALGAYAYITKPFDLKEVMAIVDGCLLGTERGRPDLAGGSPAGASRRGSRLG